MANRRYIDFPIAASVGNNDIVLIWQDGLNKQTTKATLLQGSPQSLAGLTDVDISALNNGQILQYNSTTSKWENVDRTDINLSELGDVTIVAPSNGQVLVYNSSTGKWENSSGGYVPYTGAVTTVNLGAQTIQAGSFVKAGGTSAQFLKANGSVDSTAYGTGTVTSVALTMPSAFSVGGSPITTAGTLAVTGAGTVGQYIRGDGSLADFPESSGGGSSVSYYLNGSISQGTIGGVAYRELSKVPILGSGTDFTINADGYIASFITDAGDPNLLEIPGGNWNLETYFSASSGGGSPTFYVELYKVNSGGTATLIASNSGSPELIAFGTNLTAYFSSLAVPTTTLALTDRLAIRYYVTHSGRTITLHTENGHLCEVITTFTTGLTALNGLTNQVQFFAVGTSGTDFAISSATDTHTFNLPTASGTNRGALSSSDWTTFNNKENAITAGTTAQYYRGDKTFQTLNTSVVPESGNLYFTNARAIASVLTGYTSGAGTISATDSILSAIQKLNGNISSLVTGVSSVFGRTGAVIAANGDYNTSQVTENTNLYYTEARVNANANVAANTAARHNAVTLGTANGLSLSTQQLSLQLASGSQNGALSSTDWTTFNSKENAITAGTTAQYFRGDKTFQTLNTAAVPELTNLYYTEARVNANANVAANTAARHNAVTLGTANGLSLSTQQLSLGLASAGVTGALSGTDWSTFNSKQQALNGTGFVKISGTTISYDNSTYYLASNPSAFIALTALSGTAPIQYNNLTGVISITQASGSTNGFLSSTDWTTFNNKQNALTNPVTGTGTTNYLPKFTGTSTIGNSQIFDNGTNVGIGTTSPLNKLSVVASNSSGYYNRTEAIGVFHGSLPTVLIANDGNAPDQYAELKLGNNQTTYYPYSAYIRGVQGSGIDQYRLEFGTSSGVATTTKMTLTTGGNLLVGTTTDNGQRLQVNGTGGIRVNEDGSGTKVISIRSDFAGVDPAVNVVTNNSLLLMTNNTERMRITSGGNVGIGTSSPVHLLQVNSGNLGMYSNSYGNTGLIRMYGTDGLEKYQQGLTTGGDFYQYTFTGLNHIFYTNNGSERMRITSGGNVGIGTNTPTNPLHIVSNNISQLNIQALSGNTNAQINFEPTGTGIALIGPANNVDFAFRTNATTRMTITSGGSVGIGTTSVFAPLHLNANGNFSNSGNMSTGFVISNSTTGRALNLGTFDSGGYSWIQAAYVNNADTTFALALQPRGGNVLIGTTTDTSDKLRVNGTTFSNNIMTWNPQNDNRSGIAWRFGEASIASITPNRRLRVSVNGTEYYIGAIEV